MTASEKIARFEKLALMLVKNDKLDQRFKKEFNRSHEITNILVDNDLFAALKDGEIDSLFTEEENINESVKGAISDLITNTYPQFADDKESLDYTVNKIYIAALHYGRN